MAGELERQQGEGILQCLSEALLEWIVALRRALYSMYHGGRCLCLHIIRQQATNPYGACYEHLMVQRRKHSLVGSARVPLTSCGRQRLLDVYTI